MDDDAPLGTRAWAVLLAGVGVAAWVVPMARSLWLDETLTWWVVDGSVAQTVDRAWTYQQSPFAYLLMWPFARLDGASEVLLRVPSLVAAIVGAVLLWRLAERLVGRSAGPIAVLAWIGTWATIEASDARPYALALACTIGATAVLVAALDRPTIWRGAAYGLLAASMLWAHYLFAVVLPVHLLYAIVRHRRGAPRLPIAPTIAAIAAGTVAVAPLVGQVVSLWSRRQALATGGSSVLVAPLLIANLALIPAAIATLVLTRGRVRVTRTAVAAADRVLIVAWCLVPPVLLWLVSEVSATYFINGR
jgi:mannosyltransferase